MNKSKGLLSREAIAGSSCLYVRVYARGVTIESDYLYLWRDHASVDATTFTISSTLFRRPRTSSGMAEHRTMLQCTSSLIALLQHNLTSVSAKLLARGLITDEVSDWMLTAQGVSNRDKAQRMVSCVTDRVKGSPQRFQNFIDVLSEESYFEEVVQKLVTIYNNSGVPEYCIKVISDLKINSEITKSRARYK